MILVGFGLRWRVSGLERVQQQLFRHHLGLRNQFGGWGLGGGGEGSDIRKQGRRGKGLGRRVRCGPLRRGHCLLKMRPAAPGSD